VTFTATVSPSSATGAVTFNNATYSAVLCVSVPIVNGTATCSYAFGADGDHNMVATFTGSGANAGQTATGSMDENVTG